VHAYDSVMFIKCSKWYSSLLVDCNYASIVMWISQAYTEYTLWFIRLGTLLGVICSLPVSFLFD
jgi:hypothetical protein